ncbi:predicted protein [Micromonas commoda]|uniref:Ribosomal eL28/Mak16 domain-containing protein n=1 Tax=Micromonas commoda (strain RCC299 / NOUM17 / CCMP2709) TaxID=296587 RepID=C1FDS0_MICCC|nr:predicted protein [Micromonas commoda]ACO68834.1 predicted protein [Micromonas commoda]|eukprot:XP_002507576.1 predicted protein [Micromonas commoda]
MQSDEVIWQIINRGHCSYKMKTGGATFCRNKYNVTGLCNRSSCPLANSQYATIVEERGIAYLCMKTVERAHKPATLWHRIALDGNYSKALKQVDSLLAHWSRFLLHKSKQRLTKITQYLLRTRILMREKKPRLVTIPAREQQRESRREFKAQIAAQLENSIEKELLERLRSGTYENLHIKSLKNYSDQTQGLNFDSRKHLEIEYEDDLGPGLS